MFLFIFCWCYTKLHSTTPCRVIIITTIVFLGLLVYAFFFSFYTKNVITRRTLLIFNVFFFFFPRTNPNTRISGNARSSRKYFENVNDFCSPGSSRVLDDERLLFTNAIDRTDRFAVVRLSRERTIRFRCVFKYETHTRRRAVPRPDAHSVRAKPDVRRFRLSPSPRDTAAGFRPEKSDGPGRLAERRRRGGRPADRNAGRGAPFKLVIISVNGHDETAAQQSPLCTLSAQLSAIRVTARNCRSAVINHIPFGTP